LTAAYLR